jgi:hypothetical protein
MKVNCGNILKGWKKTEIQRELSYEAKGIFKTGKVFTQNRTGLEVNNGC